MPLSILLRSRILYHFNRFVFSWGEKGLKKVALMQVYSFNLYHVSVWTQCGSKGLKKVLCDSTVQTLHCRKFDVTGLLCSTGRRKKEYDSAALDPCCWQNTCQVFNHPLLVFSISPVTFLIIYPLQGGLEHKPCVLQGGTQSIRGSAHLSSLSVFSN